MYGPADYTLSRLKMKAAENLAALMPADSSFNADSLYKMLERARNEEHGLFALPCPQLRLPGNPVAVANDLAARFPLDDTFISAKAAGPFLNISVNGSALLKDTIKGKPCRWVNPTVPTRSVKANVFVSIILLRIRCRSMSVICVQLLLVTFEVGLPGQWIPRPRYQLLGGLG